MLYVHTLYVIYVIRHKTVEDRVVHTHILLCGIYSQNKYSCSVYWSEVWWRTLEKQKHHKNLRNTTDREKLVEKNEAGLGKLMSIS